MKSTLLHKLLLIGIPILFFSVLSVSAQTLITGKVTDTGTGESVLGANIVLKGTTTGTTTDIDGNYQLEISGDAPVLVFSFIGYQAKEVVVGSQTTINVTLDVDQKVLDEVVVVGYGEQKKSLVTGSISSISAEDVIATATRPEQALQGKAAGVSVLPSSGAPGAGMSVRIRGTGSNGNSEPLYIVDGMKSDDINYLDPSDIESMEVLKDAAASAIYGSQGANGVVIITTKSGKAGQARIDYAFSYGSQSAPKSPAFMNGQQYTEYMGEMFAGNSDVTLPSGSTSTNWLDEILETAPMVRHNLSVSGGNEKSTYFVGLGYMNQDGVIGGGDVSNFKRTTARFNGSHKPTEWLELGNNIALTNSQSTGITQDDAFNGVVNSALMFDPTTPATYTSGVPSHVQALIDAGQPLGQDANGNYHGISNWMNSGEIYNPLTRLATQNGNDITKTNKLLGTVYATLKPMKGLTITSRMGIDIAYESFHDYSSPYYGNSDTNGPGLSIFKDERQWTTWLWENFVTYNKTINENHNISVVAGISAQEYTHDWLETTASPMLRFDPAFAFPDMARNDDGDNVGGSRETNKMASQFGRLSYDFKETYQVEVTVRRDGSSLFGPNYRYGVFPSVSAGWTISNESFWSSDKIDNLKLRASWGQNGSTSNLEADQYRSLVTSQNVSYVDGADNTIPGAEPEFLANPDLRWEISEQMNIGLDFSAMNDRVYANADYFNKVTKDLITPGQLTYELGNFSPSVNAGDVTNKGIELLLGYRDTKGGIKYDVSFNVSHITNEVTYLNSSVDRLGAETGLPTLGTLTFFEQGQPIWYYRGYETNGIDPATGDPIVIDQNEDGAISEEDKVNIGSPHQKWQYGGNINVSYKGVDLNLFLQGAAGGQNFMGFVRADRLNVNRLAWFYENRWTESNTSASLPRTTYNDDKFLLSDLMVDDASYLKIRQIQIGYTLPSSILEKAKIKSIRAYVSLNNYFTFTKYKGWEPEVGSDDVDRLGVDFGFYPVPRNAMFGLNISL